MVDLGSGPPVLLVPGIQGRWEWMRPAVKALAARCRVVSFSLAGDPGSGMRVDPAQGFATFSAQLDEMRERTGLAHVAVCGVSFGGLIALRYATARPDRVSALILVSTPGPDWRPDARVARYVGHPVLLAPLFAAGAVSRLGPEIVAACDGWTARAHFAVGHIARVLAAPMSPTRMSERVRLAAAEDFGAACRAVRAPTLIVTGEPRLDRVVRTGGTREYVEAIAGARAVTFERTGHIGLETRPERFAEIVGDFVEETTRPETRA